MDPRFYQIAFLASFLSLGIIFRDFSVGWPQIIAVLGTTCVAQTLWILRLRLPWTSLRSSLITGFGLLMLLRTQSLGILIFAGALAISSKFIFRL
ncbi:MAG: Na+-transporting NADH:ubiquinone oxidoreductase, subunit NqrB, partial [Chitinophagia bacterium]|nr:Na+-transporting NADH:ubiquinone oxidoreductase, subunit NqrB [Chitinophagia bacterium]